MATMFRKPKRNFRQRVLREDSDDELNDDRMELDDNESCLKTQPAAELKLPKDKKKDKPNSLLSFDNDEGDVSFQIKKSSYSKKIAKQLKRESMMEKEAKHKSISKEVKEEPPGPPAKEKVSANDNAVVEDRIKRLREEFLTMNGDDADAMEGDGSEDEDSTFKKMLKRGQIPDATTIHQIRKQRQMARDTGDFLPLDNTVKSENGSSRLVRDDDNDKSDEDDEDQRIDFSSNKSALERQKMKDEFLRAEHGSDEDDQEREWEEQQILKGVTVLQQGPSNSELYVYEQENMGESAGSNSNGYHGSSSTIQKNGDSVFNQIDASFKVASKMENLTLNVMVKRLQDRLTGMEDVHRAHELEAEKLVQDLKDSTTSVEHCERSVSSLESRFRFFQEMRGYVRDLVECLNEKVPDINHLEKRMNNLLSTRSAKLVTRRQQDVQDQCQAYMTSKSQIVMDSENQACQRRIAEREARRSRRRRRREGKNIIGHHEGLSSDDEENLSEITKFKQERDEIFQASQDLFEDVIEDFSEMDCVRGKFLDWKREYVDTYQEAYIGICIPKLVNPFIRLQLIQWNPLEESCEDFEEMQWFESLLFFGHKEEETIDRDDDDNKIIPAIIDKIILPKLASIAETQWDPMSTSQTCRFVNLVKKIQKDYPTLSALTKNTQIFLKALVTRMKKTLDDDVFLPLYPKLVLENRNSGHSVFFHRQSWTCIKLLGNILSWSGFISTKVLMGLALDGLLNRYILLGLQTAPFSAETLQKCQAIVSTLPKHWFDELQEDKTIAQLENLSRFLLYTAQLVEKACSTAGEIQKKDLRDQMKQISKLLVNIHSLDNAMKLSNMYSLGK